MRALYLVFVFLLVNTNNAHASQIVQILNPRDPVRVREVLNEGQIDMDRESRARSFVVDDARAFKRELSIDTRDALTIFLAYGLSDVTKACGMGERRALLRDAMDILGTTTFPTTDLERMARGFPPKTAPRGHVRFSESLFRKIYGHNLDVQNAEESLAWNTLRYRLRFTRNIEHEQQGLMKFNHLFHRTPTSPLDWAIVRVLAYVKS